jgi:hypothetical protein
VDGAGDITAMTKKPINFEVVDAFVSYDPFTGLFRWKVTQRGHRKAGDIAGSMTGQGRWRVKINQVTYSAGRLAWVLFHRCEPKGEIDHIDGDPLNNSIKNLRDVTHLQNCQNIKARGVSFDPKRNKWLARICVDGVDRNLGRFDLEKDALTKYQEACELYRGEFARAA